MYVCTSFRKGFAQVTNGRREAWEAKALSVESCLARKSIARKGLDAVMQFCDARVVHSKQGTSEHEHGIISSAAMHTN